MLLPNFFGLKHLATSMLFSLPTLNFHFNHCCFILSGIGWSNWKLFLHNFWKFFLPLAWMVTQALKDNVLSSTWPTILFLSMVYPLHLWWNREYQYQYSTKHSEFFLFLKIRMHSMQGGTAITRYGVTRKRSTVRKNVQLKCLLILDLKPLRS